MSGKGDCYRSAANAVLSDDNLVLVHGTVMGTGGEAKGIRYGHAWAEMGDAVLDTESGHVLRKEAYYEIGQIEDVVRYSRDEMIAMLVQFEHWGPWEET